MAHLLRPDRAVALHMVTCSERNSLDMLVTPVELLLGLQGISLAAVVII